MAVYNGWNYLFRLVVAWYAVRRWKSQRSSTPRSEIPRELQSEGWDCVTVRASAPDGSTILLSVRKLVDRQSIAETAVHIKLADGTTYKLPQHPDTVIGSWESIAGGWSAGGLKIEVLEHETRLRIMFNGLLKKDGEETVQHARFNFIWSAASPVVQYPEDWSDELAARTLALEPWRDSSWPSALGKWGDGSWLQWGAIQGRFELYTTEGATDRSEYLRARGVRERSWSPRGYQGLRRTVTLTATARDGTAVQLRGFSYKDVLTLGYSGCVRFPNSTVKSITGTDLALPNFCEDPEGIPSVCTINMSTKTRELKLVLRVNEDGGKLLSGVPYQQEMVYRTVFVDINGESGSGILELGYQTEIPGPSVPIPQHSLRWVNEEAVSQVGYCVTFEDTVAACPSYVGGKGASLALLASLQGQMGYRVPPGFCLTTKALEKHLEANPQLMAAIKEIETANVNYDENNFKEKCTKTADLFAKTEIVKEVREEILSHLSELKIRAIKENLGPELRFAVRSSAVGEDSEAMSAAGQNETILGCVSDDDVVRGVQLCWGSMFAFTSAHYRRQNGQQCLCGGGVVVQALVTARAAGVMFTRHPAAGDPSRLLITANYGLGESVVSGAVEPDTITITRGQELIVSKIELGSKKQRVTAVGSSVTTEEVSEAEQRLPCLTVSEALTLARIGVAQEEAWGAGRDIEWAVTKDEIFLLQARPITSLERWTEEELLHELDSPIMSDDELVSFANTGEVLPKPISAMTYDMLVIPLMKAFDVLTSSYTGYDNSMFVTHNRCALVFYNNIYRVSPKEIDLTTQMLEISICGHTVIDDEILRVAHHRHPYSRMNSFLMMMNSFKYLFTTKGRMKDAAKIVSSMKLDLETEEPKVLLESIADKESTMRRCLLDHGCTTAGSTTSQFIAMTVLIEGGSSFTTEQCNEVNILLSSGGVLSAEVPQALAKITQELVKSGKMEEFRHQDPKKAMDWLKYNLPKVYDDVWEFLEQHGHRAIMEFDLATKPWALVPEEMMEVLQRMHNSDDDKQKPTTKSDKEIIASLKTPQKSSTRKVLSWLLPLCRRTVRHREITKANLILAIHKLRLALLRLGKLMVKHWYLPEEDLIFHFRMHELKQYLINRDPVLLRKAYQRRQYHPSWCKLKFTETNKGWVQPLQSRGPLVTAADFKIEATAVCGGEVVARACVVKDLSEIGQLKKGDVLITHSTDIGWSPYFPLLSGIVTELGGLISHGAVIAREYGLPCLVGATDVTDMFRTGDMVRLSASKGFLEKVQLADNPSEVEQNDT
ncbi:uncharacterized phosphotransferase YvkC-like isoform X2 [Pectinophora gossypiella]|uniref:uncharacterized phosphotransferase YvkC-like isoform X2 n=1 Tax=Pectinophora gossypiella TaxID=13191 RepID=UPI00214F3056|nr:uncharacterized phosphotransferase YvkC-like isoform X2 [Pectinophora gossypiella]